MLSSDFPSALTPSVSSVPAVRSSSSAAIPYPKLTRQADPDSISQSIKRGEKLPPIAVRAHRNRQWLERGSVLRWRPFQRRLADRVSRRYEQRCFKRRG